MSKISASMQRVDRAQAVGAKLEATRAAGVAGTIVWRWKSENQDESSIDGFEINPVIRSFQSLRACRGVRSRRGTQRPHIGRRANGPVTTD